MKISFLYLFLVLGSAGSAQEIKDTITVNPDTLHEWKTNPIVFADVFFGGAFGHSSGLVAGFSGNYQYKSHLFTARYTVLWEYQRVGRVIVLPVYRTTEELEEFALLYGYRTAKDYSAYSFSVGASVVHRDMYGYDNEGVQSKISHTRFSIPFEVSVKWFKKEKSPYHVYCVLPVGPPTGLGHSFGFKVVGNVGATTFIGLGITWGWGWHKQY